MSAVDVREVWSDEKMPHLPTGTNYTTVAKFPEDSERWPMEAWSVVIEFAPGSAMNSSFEAKARFLMPDAPVSRFATGRTFDLYEGNIRTATVTVL